MNPYLTLALLWILWCTLHSLLISRPVTGYLSGRHPGLFRYYRLFYNAFAVVTLTGVLAYGLTVDGPPVFRWEGLLRLPQAVLIAAAVVLFAAGGRRYDLAQFLGLRQARAENACATLTDDCEIDTRGVLGLVRHPWYTGGILIVWARNLDMAAVVTNLAICLYFVVGAMLEERKLRAEFGARYEAYQRRVSMFLPFKWLGRRWRGRAGHAG